jgi:hypothetical protein
MFSSRYFAARYFARRYFGRRAPAAPITALGLDGRMQVAADIQIGV